MTGPTDSPAEGKPRSKRFFYVRVSVLLAILAGVLLWAWRDVRMRRARNEWDHTLYVAVVLVRLESVDDAAVTALRGRVPALEDRLTAEMSRHGRGPMHPFRFQVLGPVDGASPPPLPTGDGPVDLAQHSLAVSNWVKEVDGRTAVEGELFDSRIYVALRRPRRAERTLVEGRSEQGGRVGIVEVELDAEAADLPLIVVAHELMHTLGATDKYDANGRTVVPMGLAEPDRVPLYPQRFAELMTRNRPLSPTEERVPGGFDEIAIGPVTAREIGWLR